MKYLKLEKYIQHEAALKTSKQFFDTEQIKEDYIDSITVDFSYGMSGNYIMYTVAIVGRESITVFDSGDLIK